MERGKLTEVLSQKAWSTYHGGFASKIAEGSAMNLAYK